MASPPKGQILVRISQDCEANRWNDCKSNAPGREGQVDTIGIDDPWALLARCQSTNSIRRDKSLAQIDVKAEAETREIVTEKFASKFRAGRSIQGVLRIPDNEVASPKA